MYAQIHGNHVTLISSPPHRHANSGADMLDGSNYKCYGYREFYCPDGTLRAWDHINETFTRCFALDEDEAEALRAAGYACRYTE